MAKCKFFILLIAFAAFTSEAQVNQYFVFFKNKSGTPYTVASPSQFLSERSVARRQKQSISIIEEDLPVNPAYVSQVKEAGATVFFSSRWWNGVLVECDPVTISSVNALSFVSNSVLVAPGKKNVGGRVRVTRQKKNSTADQPVNQTQLQQIGLDEMHKQGYAGEGIWVAIFDSGFQGVNLTEPFSHLFTENRVKYTFNFVSNSNNVFQLDDHGTEALSVMAANTTGVYSGGVHKATYLLYVTEDVNSEYRVEEFNWTVAAERADSAGVDVINSSLGYYEFDDPSMDYSKSDLTGEKAVITQASRIAIEKGMVVVCSAGNEGGNSWKLITPPADAKGVIAVGSVNAQGSLSSFSSVGPTADGRIKPEVVALGSGTSVIKASGVLGFASGTSLASPLVASLAAGVLQAFPGLSAGQVHEAIIHSADQASNPDNLRGYGLPHFRAIKNFIQGNEAEELLSVYPNPVSGNCIQVRLKSIIESPIQISIFDAQGKRAEEYSNQITWLNNPLEYDLSKLQAGLYFIRIKAGSQTATLKFVKL